MKKRHRGGVLLTALLFIFLFSFIFILVLEDFQLTQRFSQKTRDYYIARTMSSMFFFDVKQEQRTLDKTGYQKFSTGILYYEYDQKTIKFTVRLDQETYKFQEEYQKNSNKITIDQEEK
ncbi:competence type IV pilus minor pilin ComGG [Candidatus Enterococcus ikei]|uniref:Late competence protein ComGG n=1 Tax=Candidatus Enterococcus ikei TaxID=2815326 RepID=A0ABS3H051_9ENTE|nr:competence type IV pilus minor pilin ComGG [Enterococcus sp. DIV0869a]MBO0440882.1 hypothetical protein [Enterococcus sp. DIV0869a]